MKMHYLNLTKVHGTLSGAVELFMAKKAINVYGLN